MTTLEKARCPLMAHSGLIEWARRTSAIGGKADTPHDRFFISTPLWLNDSGDGLIPALNFVAGP